MRQKIIKMERDLTKLSKKIKRVQFFSFHGVVWSVRCTVSELLRLFMRQNGLDLAMTFISRSAVIHQWK